MFNFIANSLVIAGAGILVGSLVPVRQLLTQLPPGQVRSRWYLMAALTLLFIAGCLGYAKVFWNNYIRLADLIVPGVFFFGACFVWSSCMLSLQAVNDFRRVIRLERESITDPLSGIYNRRYLDRMLEEEFAKVQRYDVPLSILLVDIDHFKQVNDTFGHQAGDNVLCCLSQLILNAVRAADIAARYGGDEFLIIAPNTSVSVASSLAERLRLHIESHEFALPDDPGERHVVRVTVSIGVARCNQKTENVEKLLQAADVALYRAKDAGRNQVMVQNPR